MSDTGVLGRVVSEASATRDVAPGRKYGVAKTHIGIAKPRNRTEFIYRWLRNIVGDPSHQMDREVPLRAHDVTAQLLIDAEDVEQPMPPKLEATHLEQVASRVEPYDDRKSWEDGLLQRSSQLLLTGDGTRAETEIVGERTERWWTQTIMFPQLLGQLNNFQDRDSWKGAWIEAKVDGQSDDKEWDAFLQDFGDVAEAKEEFREYYKLKGGHGKAKGDWEVVATGEKAMLKVFVNGREMAMLEGLLVRTGTRFHGMPDTYTIRFRPSRVEKGVAER